MAVIEAIFRSAESGRWETPYKYRLVVQRNARVILAL